MPRGRYWNYLDEAAESFKTLPLIHFNLIQSFVFAIHLLLGHFRCVFSLLFACFRVRLWFASASSLWMRMLSITQLDLRKARISSTRTTWRPFRHNSQGTASDIDFAHPIKASQYEILCCIYVCWFRVCVFICHEFLICACRLKSNLRRSWHRFLNGLLRHHGIWESLQKAQEERPLKTIRVGEKQYRQNSLRCVLSYSFI